ncbi:MAG: IPT/TIG domain-containing protein [Candidatus Paceibacterota bacterium]
MRKVLMITFLVLIAGVAIWFAPKLSASTYFRMFILNRNGGATLPQGVSAIPPPVISSSTYAGYTSSSSTVRQAAYASSSAAIIEYFNKIGDPLALATYPTTTPKISISSLSKSDANPGSLISIFGKGFDKLSNTVHFNDKKVDNLSSSLGTAIAVRIPVDVYGTVLVRVESKGEMSNVYPLIIKKVGAVAPKISLADKSLKLSSKITFKGSGIAKVNTVHTTLGSLVGVTSNDKDSLSFSFSDVPGFSAYLNVPKQYLASTSVMMWVSNENGTSNILGPVTIDFSK